MRGSPRPATGPSARVLALGAWIVILFVGANQALFWSPERTAVHLRLGLSRSRTLAYYAILVGLRPHHLVIWGAVFVAGLVPIWGGLGVDRDPLAMIPLGSPRWSPGCSTGVSSPAHSRCRTGDRLEGTRVGR